MMSSQPDCETSINPLLQYEGTFILRKFGRNTGY